MTEAQSIIFVCCECEPDQALDQAALALILKLCPTHGEVWHRRMVRQADGSLVLWIEDRRRKKKAHERAMAEFAALCSGMNCVGPPLPLHR